MDSSDNRQRVFIIEERRNPSTDFFVRSRFPSSEYEVVLCSRVVEIDREELHNAIVVLVRYLTSEWKKLLESDRQRLQKLVYFMDDDLFDWRSYRNQSLRYQYKLYSQATRYKQWIIDRSDAIWVSTPVLQKKYSELCVEQIDPQPYGTSKRFVRVFYHGSASHKSEIDWLYPVIKNVLEKQPNVIFEIIGDETVYKQFRRLPRVQVIHPMNWDSYQDFIRQPGRDIGLAPLLDNSFNQFRSHTKVFDIQASGAVGIYAAGSESAEYIYRNYGDDESKGIVLPMEQSLWVKKIVELAKTASFRT